MPQRPRQRFDALHHRLCDARLLQPHVAGTEQQLRNNKALVAEGEDAASFFLLSFSIVSVRRASVARSDPRPSARSDRVVRSGEAAVHAVVVGEDVVDHDLLACLGTTGGGGALPRSLEVGAEVGADETCVFFHLPYDPRLVDEAEVAQGDELGEVVPEVFSSDVDAADAGLEEDAAEDGGDEGMTVSAVDDETDLGGVDEGGWIGG